MLLFEGRNLRRKKKVSQPRVSTFGSLAVFVSFFEPFGTDMPLGCIG